MNKKLLIIFLAIFLISMSFASAETTCKRDDCEITITIKIAFSGTDNATIEDWVKDITDTWNGHTFGDCECPVKVEVEWKNVGSGGCQANYSSNEADYHCINVSNTTYVQAAGNRYRGFMWGISKSGSSTAGFWGTSINDPLPGVDGTIHDAAHEAGHMMGLNDTYNASTGTYPPNIMGRTWGANATPTQGQIDQIVENNCKGDDAECPDHCCCGNGKFEPDKGEECENNTDCKDGLNPLCLNCKCYYMNICGDGIISGEEECDPAAMPTGCNETSVCDPVTCACEQIELSVKITDPDEDDIFGLDDWITVKLDIDNAADIKEVEFYIREKGDDYGSPEETIIEEPWEWEFLAGDFGPGTYAIKVIVYDEDGNEADDEVKYIEIE
ncbi:MAG: hypothetical protein IB618_00745 [Candidatus Pacearchaeota archaeon]|nr:MAG: hypothetical protein IB618_00745 [Candidatus Pacearchaeota archaeon]